MVSITDAREFEWESQLRFYWVKEPDELFVRQCSAQFCYGYEYMGLNGRLVITPLTDRIYLTLTQVPSLRSYPTLNGLFGVCIYAINTLYDALRPCLCSWVERQPDLRVQAKLNPLKIWPKLWDFCVWSPTAARAWTTW